MKFLLASITATALAAGTACATLMDYSTDFASGDGFSDATSIDEIDGWNARSDTPLAANTGTYGSLLLGNGPAFTQKGSGGSWNTGDTILLTANVFFVNTTDRSRFRLGLTDVINDTAGQPLVGFEWDVRSGGSIFAFGGGINEDTGLDSSTGQGNGELFTVALTKSTSVNEIDVAVSFRGGAWTDSFTATDATLYGAANVYGHVQHNGASTNGTLDGYSQAYTAIPEPSTLALLGVGVMALVSRLRKRR